MKIILKYLPFLSFILTTGDLFSQKPREISLQDDPVDWTDPAMIIVLIIVPVALLVAGIMIKLRYDKRKKKDQSN